MSAVATTIPAARKSRARRTLTDSPAIVAVPPGNSCLVGESTPFGSTAKPLLPRGHGGSAVDSTPIESKATATMPRGRHPPADDSTPSDPAATASLPTGHCHRAAGSDTHVETIGNIRELWRRRRDLHRAEKSLTLQIRGICRRLCAGLIAPEWQAGRITEAQYRKQVKAEADVLYTALVKSEPHALFMPGTVHTGAFFQAREVFATQRAATEKLLEREAKTLPLAAYVAGIRGFGIASLAALIGETGDLRNYSTHSKLWKRLGLAVIDGGRQRRIAGDAAIAHGYCAERRSVMWNIGQCVLKSQSVRVDKETGEVLREAGTYRRIYDARKAYEAGRTETAAHAHNRATRYMEKAIVRDLWAAARAIGGEA